LVNLASIASTDTTLSDSNSSNNSVSRTSTLNAQVDLVVAKSVLTTNVIAGNPIQYQIDVSNTGLSTATGVTLTDLLPSGVTFVDATAQQGTVSHANGTVSGNLGSIGPGQSVRVTVNGTVNADARGILASSASADSAESDVDSDDNTISVNSTVTATNDLRITKSKTNPTDPAVAGGPLGYVINVSNTGPSSATNVQVVDDLPNGLTFTSGSVTGQSTPVIASGQRATINLGSLGPNDTRTINISADVAASAAGTLSNTATVTGTESDSNSTNNSSTLATPLAVVGSIRGRTYLDANRDGLSDSNEAGMPGVAVALSGSDIVGRSVNQTTTTDSAGEYAFTNLHPGTYTITQTQPLGFRSASTNPGSAGGTASNNVISGVTITSAQTATSNNFGEIPNPLSLRRFLASSSAFD
jgi:uncharacterized repeat protein (TIGR01451 family)